MRNELARKREEKYVQDEFRTLRGRTIVDIRILTDEECADMMWEPGYRIPLVIIFDDGQAAIVSSDPEGNAPGWLFLASVIDADD